MGVAGLAYPACAAICPKGRGYCPYPGHCFLYTDVDANSLCDYTARSATSTPTAATPIPQVTTPITPVPASNRSLPPQRSPSVEGIGSSALPVSTDTVVSPVTTAVPSNASLPFLPGYRISPARSIAYRDPCRGVSCSPVILCLQVRDSWCQDAQDRPCPWRSRTVSPLESVK